MMAFAKKGKHNFSTNPTYLESGSLQDNLTNVSYKEGYKKIKNISKSNFAHHSASFENVTYISKVGIYDEDKNLIAIATLANPIKKTPDRDYMIKMRMDF